MGPNHEWRRETEPPQPAPLLAQGILIPWECSAPPLQYRHHNAAGFGTQRRRISRSLSKKGVGVSRTRRDSPAPPERTLPEGVRGSFPKKNIARGGKGELSGGRPAAKRPASGRPEAGRPSGSRRPADGRTAESNSILF